MIKGDFFFLIGLINRLINYWRTIYEQMIVYHINPPCCGLLYAVPSCSVLSYITMVFLFNLSRILRPGVQSCFKTRKEHVMARKFEDNLIRIENPCKKYLSVTQLPTHQRRARLASNKGPFTCLHLPFSIIYGILAIQSSCSVNGRHQIYLVDK